MADWRRGQGIRPAGSIFLTLRLSPNIVGVKITRLSPEKRLAYLRVPFKRIPYKQGMSVRKA